MIEYVLVQGCEGDGDWIIMEINDETIQMEKIGSRKSDQSEFKIDWQGKEDETEDNKHITTTED